VKNILITGTSGYVGTQIIEKIKSGSYLHQDIIGEVVALDIKDNGTRVEGVEYYFEDIRNLERMKDIFQKHKVNTVIHMAAILAPSSNIPIEMMYEINVVGTRNLLKCSKINAVERFISASSGAAYGYHADNSEWLSEDVDKIRGNLEFPYAFHKRLNEEDFEIYNDLMPQMSQFIFRIGSVLGVNVNNLITDLFKKPVVTGIKGSDAPFVFIWDEDLVDILLEAITSKKPGRYNVAGDGAVNLPEIAKKLNKKYIAIPSKLVEKALSFLNATGLSQYGPEQVKFLKYRPVLDNKKLKNEFGYIPKKTSLEVFNYYLENRKFS
jgi:UDP-glucose 4-epimerase